MNDFLQSSVNNFKLKSVMEVDVHSEEVRPVPVLEIKDESMSELEDGELEDDSDDEQQVVKDRRITYGSSSSSSKDILSLRAERFGVTNNRRLPQDPDIRKLHISMGVNNKTRTEALHLYGTDSMQTQDIFHYFDYTPASVEWLSDQACNVVWLDEETCAKALAKHSTKIRGQPETPDSDSDGEEHVNVEDLRCALPPGGVWRKGHTKAFAQNVLIRFATVADKKELRPNVPESLRMKAKLFPDGGDESVKKVRIEEDETSNPWSGIARQWGKFERGNQNKFGCTDARQLIKEKELRDNLIKKDARDLLKYNRICRLEQELETENSLSSIRGRSHRMGLLKRSWTDDNASAHSKRTRISPHKEENLHIIVENDSYKPRRKKSVTSSSESSSSSSGDSSSSSSDSSSSSSSSEDEDEPPTVKAPSLKQPWNKSSNKFKPSSSLLIEIDNDHYRKKRSSSD